MRAERQNHSTWREGIIAGVLGATGVAVWFLVVDLIAAQLFFTPTRLGMAFGQVFRVPAMEESGAIAFIGYTILHYAVFAAIGLLAAAVVHGSRQSPSVLAGAFLAFVVSEALIYGFIELLHSTDLLEHLTWWLLAIGNLIGAALVGWKLWRDHPALRAGFDNALGERQGNYE